MVKGKSRVAWVLMEGVQVVSVDGAVLTLAFENDSNRRAFANGRDGVVREALKEFLGVDWRIETVTGAPGASGAPGQAAGSPSGPAGRGPRQAGGPAVGGSASGGPVSGAAVPAAAPPVREPAPPAPPAPDEPPPPPPPIDERDEVDPEGDANADDDSGAHSGMALIQRELGGQVIQEIDNSSS
jgi:DNA polymerase-3 subunit gamma/tau